jgi:hypothetical protein
MTRLQPFGMGSFAAVSTRVLATAGVVLVLLLAGCSGDRKPEPTIATVDFTPRVAVSVDERGFRVESVDSSTASIDPEQPVVSAGTVVEIRNVGTDARRVVAGTKIDTGVMEPGDTTTVVLSEAADLELRDVDSGLTLAVTVEPRTPNS